ncbi:MAG: hypothetical protein ACRDKB_14930 [Actinomycetota bacterium]
MTRKVSFSAFVIAVATVISLAVALVTPVGAHHKDGHERGKSNGSSETTEDNDNDGVPNSPDPEGDSDNKHPSGKDKHDEPGGSGNQGRTQSNPDNDGRGPERNSCPGSGEGECVDQPGGDGGVDQLDQDGNNGCGNDDDFEDDNEGLCLGRQGERPGQQLVGVAEEVDVVLGEIIFQRPSLGKRFERPAAVEEEQEVLGGRITREAAPEVAAEAQAQPKAEGILPVTGAALSGILLGLGLMLAGSGLLRISRK